jgi:hypothetical protein
VRLRADANRSARLFAIVLASGALAQAGCGGGSAGPRSAGESTATRDGNPTATSPARSQAGETAAPAGSRTGGDPYSEAARSSEAALIASVRAYVGAIDARDGRAVCKLLAPGALRGFRLPRGGPGCAGAVSASLGYSIPGGPAWRRTEIRRIDSVELDPQRPGDARVRATVVHRFAHHREPSIEDDLIYPRRSGGRWLIAKPSSTLYRAVGAENVPLRAITPP